jgi:hypothetical protein
MVGCLAITFNYMLYNKCWVRLNTYKKGKGHPITGHQGPRGEWRYSSSHSRCRQWKGVGGQYHVLAALPPGKTRYPLYRRLDGPLGQSGHVRKISPPLEFGSQTFQPVAIHYTDWATRPLNTYIHFINYYKHNRTPHLITVSTAVALVLK